MTTPAAHTNPSGKRHPSPAALVTGAARGLGRQIALALSAAGYRVAVNFAHSDAEAEDLVRRLGKNGVAVKADVGDAGQVESMAAEIREVFGRLDCVINNAAIAKDDLLVKQREHDWDAVLRTNLKGCFHIMRTTAPLMIKSGGGHFVNISSYSGVKGKRGQAAYSASKAAILGLTYSSAAELAPHKIRVNAVLPGYMPTDMGVKAATAADLAKQQSMLNTLSRPETVADFIVYLLKTDTITGQVFSLDSRIL